MTKRVFGVLASLASKIKIALKIQQFTASGQSDDAFSDE
jgi:hypothetical protein